MQLTGSPRLGLFSRIQVASAVSLFALIPLCCAASYYGLQVEVTIGVECSRRTAPGDNLIVDYRGTFADGAEVISSYDKDHPFYFMLGAQQVIEGWDVGLLDMCVGDARRLTIPPEMAYGSRPAGPIPPGSTLVFDISLLSIDDDDWETANFTISLPPSLPNIMVEGDYSDGECRLLGPFALLVQAALGIFALSSLVWKRWRETPQRQLKIWWFDVSKQLFGSGLLHLANLFMSMLSSGSFDVNSGIKTTTSYVGGGVGKQPNPCSFYLLNLAIDTTIGIPILVVLLRLLHAGVFYTPLANPPESVRSGNYGTPPRATWWLKQSFIYFIGLFGMKFCVFVIFQLLPWIAWVGDWALRWTEGNETIQITFVMLIFPLIMNAVQYYIIDSFIKDPDGGVERDHDCLPAGNMQTEDRTDRSDNGSNADEDNPEQSLRWRLDATEINYFDRPPPTPKIDNVL